MGFFFVFVYVLQSLSFNFYILILVKYKKIVKIEEQTGRTFIPEADNKKQNRFQTKHIQWPLDKA